MAKDSVEYSKSFVISVIIHVVFFAVLITTMSFSTPKQTVTVNLAKDPKIVKANLVDKRAADLALQRQIAEEQQKIKAHEELLRFEQLKAEQLKVEQLKVEQQRAEQLKLAQATAQKATQQKIQKEQQQAKKQQQQLQVKKDAEKKQAAQKLATENKVAEQKKQASEKSQQAMAKQAAANAKQAAAKDQAAKAEAARVAALKAQQDILAAEHAEFLASEVDIYRAAIQAAIEDNRILSSVFSGDISCKIRIKLLPDGSILSVNVVEASGNPAYDEMSAAAVYKSAPFPMPQDQELYAQLRDIVLSFRNGDQPGDVF